MSYYFTNQYTSKQNSIKNLLNDLFSYTEENDMPVQANIISKEKEILIQMQTPGIPKEDINIDFNSNYLVVTYEASQEESIEGTYTQQQIFTESFNKENLIGLAISNFASKTDESYKTDSKYNYLDDPQLLPFENYLTYFSNSVSAENTKDLIRQLKVDKVRGILSPLSVVGTLTGAITDPSTLLLMGKGKKFIEVAAGGKRFMSPTRLGLTMTSEELAKQSLDKDRDIELGLTVAGVSFLIPGLVNKINGIGGLKSTKAFSKHEKYTNYADDIEKSNANAASKLDDLEDQGIDTRYLDPNTTREGKSAGAASNPSIKYKTYNEELIGEEIAKTLTGLENSPLTSVFRGLQKSVLSARNMVTELLEIPLYQKKNFDMKGGVTTISVENEVNRGRAIIISNMRAAEDMYEKYLARMSKELRKDIGTVSRIIKKQGYSKDGIMSFPDFRNQISKALVQRSSQFDDEVVQAARMIREDFFDLLGKRADDSGLFTIMPRKLLMIVGKAPNKGYIVYSN